MINSDIDEQYKFSVLMPVYCKENPDFFKTALESIINQTLQPNEIVIVKDGPLTKELDEIIESFSREFPELFHIISLEKNVGLGEALKIGLSNCKYEYIARMDADDIARNDRFEKQINFLKTNTSVDIVGSWISEFDNNPKEINSYRQVPILHDEIYKFGQFRCPMNHMTVIFKKQVVLNVGNYLPFKNIEDYYLWGRLLKRGYKFANIPECLVNVRAGHSMLKRRANLTYFFNSEFPLHTEFYKMKFINLKQYLRNISSKFLLRILPTKIMGLVYKKFLRKDTIQNDK